MKKLLVLAMVAFAFLACNEGASVPKKDKNAAKAVTSQAFDLLGKSSEKVDKALEDAGFTKVEGGGLLGIAKREQARVRKSVKEEDLPGQVMYLYNVPENYQKMSEEEGAKYVKSVLDKGECIIFVMAIYSPDNKLLTFSTQVMAPLKDNINLLLTEISDEEYKKLPKASVVEGEPTTSWEGFIQIGDEEDDPYSDHAKFVAKVAKAKAIVAEEQGYSITEIDVKTAKVSGFLYNNYWLNPDADEQEKQIDESGFAAAFGVFVVVDYSEIGRM